MKLQIVTNPETKIKGFNVFLLSDLNVLSEEVGDNQCEQILATDTMNQFRQEEVFHFLNILISKLRLNGTLTVSGIETRLFCKGVLNGLIDQQLTNRIVSQCKSMIEIDVVKNFFHQHGLEIERSTISGLNYEITAKRKK